MMPRIIVKTLGSCLSGVLLLFFALGVQAGSLNQELRDKIKAMGPGDPVRVIVRCADKVDVRQFREKDIKVRRQRLTAALKDKTNLCEQALQVTLRNGDSRPTVLWTINGVAATVPVSLVDSLVKLPGVESVTLDAEVVKPVSSTSTFATPEWNLEAIRAPALWAMGHDGTGVVVAAMDTGVDPYHPDIGPKWRGGTNSWFDPNGQHATPYDADGHGTWGMGLIVGGDAGGSAIGVAPGAQWIAVKIFDDSGQSLLSRIHQGFQWVLDPDDNPETNDAADIVNNSWYLQSTLDTCNTEFSEDIAALKAADIAVMFAAGNTGPNPNTSVSPSNDPQGLAVGAVDSNRIVGDFSARGASACGGGIYPGIMAPGVTVRTADLTFGGIFPNSYTTVTGTSFAAPHLAGGMALLKSAMVAQGVPVTASLLETAVEQTAVDLGATGPDNDYGAGLLDVMEAYNWLLANAGSPQPGRLQLGATDYSVAENGVTATIEVVRTGGSDGTVTVGYATSNGSATAGTDYSATSGTLSFDPGMTSRTFDVAILDDAAYEGDETVSLALGNVTGGATLGSPNAAVLTIVDNDPQNSDNDGDGYASSVDCNDSNPSIYPGAPEVKHDGIDQDCNGYDLTINIIKAQYNKLRRKLTVEATSALGAAANLQLQGYGPMTWKRIAGKWSIVITGVGRKPATITVTGVEGSVSAPVKLTWGSVPMVMNIRLDASVSRPES